MTNYIFMISVITILVLAVLAITFCNIHLNNDQYDRLKYIVLKWSAITTFLGVIVATFNDIPYGKETITIVAAIGALLAEVLNTSHKNHTDGATIYEDDQPLEDGDLDE